MEAVKLVLREGIYLPVVVFIVSWADPVFVFIEFDCFWGSFLLQ
jgi:hypothetical protein